ncbi:hypothetical protein GCM10027610_051650 [Dactylosporangium cerinum]
MLRDLRRLGGARRLGRECRQHDRVVRFGSVPIVHERRIDPRSRALNDSGNASSGAVPVIPFNTPGASASLSLSEFVMFASDPYNRTTSGLPESAPSPGCVPQPVTRATTPISATTIEVLRPTTPALPPANQPRQRLGTPPHPTSNHKEP